jgi:GTP-binding protein EngB required for normal cell division
MARGTVTIPAAAPLPPVCHAPTSGAAPQAGAVQVALIGLPNTGKSTLFNRVTGGNAQIANWPGLTVDLVVVALKRKTPASCRAPPS